MSRLSVYWPEDVTVSTDVEDRMILPFPRNRGLQINPVGEMDIISRARALFNNRQCTDCGYPVVEPIELADPTINRNGMAIPGTATLVGFRCCGCRNEWSV